MTSQDILIELIDWYYHDSRIEAKVKKVVYLSAFAPVELLRAMDVVCFYPENQSVVSVNSGKGVHYLRGSYKKGYSINLCGYARVDLGGADDRGASSFPDPNIIIGSNNQCGTIHPWFAAMGRWYHAPVILLDYPPTTSMGGHREAYIADQHRSLIDVVAMLTGRPFDEKRFNESVRLSRIACNYWKKIQDLARHSPSTIHASELFNALMPIVVARGTKFAADYYKALYEEHLAATPGLTEEHRILWYGYPFWFLRKRLPDSAATSCIASTYATWWLLNYGDRESFASIISAYGKTYLSMSSEERFRHMRKMIEEYSIDGVIIHVNRSCKPDAIGAETLKRLLASVGVPSFMFEADMMDEKAYAKRIVTERIETFLKIITERD